MNTICIPVTVRVPHYDTVYDFLCFHALEEGEDAIAQAMRWLGEMSDIDFLVPSVVTYRWHKPAWLVGGATSLGEARVFTGETPLRDTRFDLSVTMLDVEVMRARFHGTGRMRNTSLLLEFESGWISWPIKTAP